MKCWGWNAYGQLGTGDTKVYLTPQDASGLGSGVTALVVGGYHNFALQSGAVKAWGIDTYGQLGLGYGGITPTPTDVTGF